MARISKFLGQPLPGTESGLFGLPIIQDYDALIREGGRKPCLITCKKEPEKGGFFNDDGGGYTISTDAVLNKESIEGYIHLGRTLTDAMLDAGMSKEEMEEAKKWILDGIQCGMNKQIG